MNLEEKIRRLQETSMEEARAEGNAIIDNYRAALDKVLEAHKEEALLQSETRVKAETISAKQQLNRAMAKTQLDMKRQLGKVSLELKDQIFEETLALVNGYMNTDAYEDYLIKCIRHAVAFANGEHVVIYLNVSDEKRRSDLEDATGVRLTISAEDFIGGIRAVIRSHNILIDHSFQSALRNEYDSFVFSGGDTIA